MFQVIPAANLYKVTNLTQVLWQDSGHRSTPCGDHKYWYSWWPRWRQQLQQQKDDHVNSKYLIATAVCCDGLQQFATTPCWTHALLRLHPWTWMVAASLTTSAHSLQAPGMVAVAVVSAPGGAVVSAPGGAVVSAPGGAVVSAPAVVVIGASVVVSFSGRFAW